MNSPYAKAYLAESDTAQFLIAKQGTDDNKVVTSDVAATTTLGVISQPGTVKAGESTDVVLLGETEVKCGGSVLAGNSITGDALGKAVAATTGQKAVGIALTSGAANEIIKCLVSPHTA